MVLTSLVEFLLLVPEIFDLLLVFFGDFEELLDITGGPVAFSPGGGLLDGVIVLFEGSHDVAEELFGLSSSGIEPVSR